ncbi:hypothetical protein P2H44_10880 [Albimonas sp. CAU 1670]|uniref:hypothetical protein n=1 Tax=Albimonas sp. CAU 1670 TaxID=3032599 RepID=UPI0023DAC4FD|nr:hypothetical protein [Albimonas sp. CAU 1670]MDF2233055.1 hypothetical protein [Albimonas sp. CAU 1670]
MPRPAVAAAPVLAAALAAVPASSAAAPSGCRMNVAEFVGWQIIYRGTLSGTVDPSGRSETFQGCVPGRILLLDEDRSVVCTGAGLGAGWRPDVVVLSDGRRMVACIADRLYAVRD